MSAPALLYETSVFTFGPVKPTGPGNPGSPTRSSMLPSNTPAFPAMLYTRLMHYDKTFKVDFILVI